MPTKLLAIFIIYFCSLPAHADRIYIMNAPGYNTAGTELISAITSNGHTVVSNTSNLNALPIGFTTSCVDNVNGYDWLCFFGNYDFSGLQVEIQNFIDAGGKVFFQYEVTCCVSSAVSTASIVSGLTGLTVEPNIEPYYALGSGQGWESVGCCVTFYGNAYRCLDGVPSTNALNVTGDLNGASPSFVGCPNFGFVFSSADMISGQNRGGIVGFGDVNIWYDGGEPWSNGGSNPINMDIVDFIFPNSSATCFLLPSGCSTNPIVGSTSQGGAVSLGADQSLCPQDTIVLSPSGVHDTYLWQDNSASPTFEVTSPGLYWVEVSNSCGTSRDSVQIVASEFPSVDLGPDFMLCVDSTTQLTAVLNDVESFQWNDSSTDTTLMISQGGIYWVEATNSCGSASDTVLITEILPPEINLGEDTILCEGEELLLSANVSGGSYLWQNGSILPSISVNSEGTYWLVVNINNCISSDTIVVLSELCTVILEMPNIITPNSDSSNDFFVPIVIEGISEANITIINRWGNIMYESDDLNLGWNGKVNNVDCADGTYFWKVTYTDQLGASGEKHGFVVVVR